MNEEEKVKQELFNCPFCNAINFNKLGLNVHLALGRCRGYNATPISDEAICDCIPTPIDPPRPIGGYKEWA